MPRTLVVYYSRSGHTRAVAKQVAERLGADVEEINDPTKRTGLFGYQLSGFQAFFRRLPDIAPAVRDPHQYDLVVVGTPIWDMSVSAPVRAYLRRYRAVLPKVAFFCTCGGAGAERAFAQMTKECGQSPVATMVLTEHELTTPAVPLAIARFLVHVRAALSGVRRAA